MKLTLNGKSVELFDEPGLGAVTYAENLMLARARDFISQSSQAGAIKDEDIRNAQLAAIMVVSATIEPADLAYNDWYSVFAMQTEPTLSVAEFNRIPPAIGDEYKKKYWQALDFAGRFASQCKRLVEQGESLNSSLMSIVNHPTSETGISSSKETTPSA